MTVDVAEEFAGRMEAARVQNDGWVEWMKSFHNQLAELTQNYENVCNDLKRERIAGRETQKEAEKWERQFYDIQRSVENGSFVLVLIDADADAYIFKDDYYRSPDGGRKAALDLQAWVRCYLRKTKPALAGLPIVVKAFANATGLSKYLLNTLVIDSTSALWDFANEISQAHAVSDFVLVGSGKERVDKKIQGVFEQFVKSPTCRHILFGACHDNGYVRMLEDYVAVAERITLLHSFEIGREFKMLPMQSTKIDAIFRTVSLQSPNTARPVIYPEASRSESVQSVTPRSWAALAGVSGGPGKASLPTETNDSSTGTVLVNAAGHRVDVKLPQAFGTAVESWDHKVNKVGLRFCRMYQLSGGCRGKCGYSHGPLTDEEKLVYRRQLRGERCHSGLRCRDVNCFYGHNCVCKKAKCKFPAEMHRVDDATASVWTG